TSVCQPIDSSNPESILIAGMSHIYDEYYSRKLSKTTHDSLKVQARKAAHCGGIPPLGYDLNDEHKLIINESEAVIVREIFRLYLLGWSYRKMAELLNKKGFTTKTGRPFTKNSFSNILTQEKYIGIYRWNRAQRKNRYGQRNSHASKPLEEQIIITGGCPAIIDEADFQNVKQKLAERAEGKAESKSRHHYFLGGMKLLKCASCGRYMVGKTTRTHGREYTVYSCPNHKGGHCPTKDLPAEGLDRYVSILLTHHLLTKIKVRRLNQIFRQEANDKEAYALKNKLVGLEKKIANLSLVLEDGYSETVANSLIQKEREKKETENQLTQAKGTSLAINVEELPSLKRSFAKKLVTSEEPEVRELLREYIKEIVIGNEEVTVDLNL
ncbi:MAG: recombinase family protein, partial [Anaerotignum sp.]|nr:recombinase family protein [Anaerotignum sp.]